MISLSKYLIIEKFNNRYPVVYVMVGIPGSGKSTWCKKNHPDLPVISRDMIRTELGFTQNADQKAVLSKDDERKVTKIEYERISQYADDAWHKKIKGFIIDDTNTGIHRTELIDKLHSLSLHVIGVNINTPLETCIERRKDQIPKEVMIKLYNTKKELQSDEVDEIINVKNI